MNTPLVIATPKTIVRRYLILFGLLGITTIPGTLLLATLEYQKYKYPPESAEARVISAESQVTDWPRDKPGQYNRCVITIAYMYRGNTLTNTITRTRSSQAESTPEFDQAMQIVMDLKRGNHQQSYAVFVRSNIPENPRLTLKGFYDPKVNYLLRAILWICACPVMAFLMHWYYTKGIPAKE